MHPALKPIEPVTVTFAGTSLLMRAHAPVDPRDLPSGTGVQCTLVEPGVWELDFRALVEKRDALIDWIDIPELTQRWRAVREWVTRAEIEDRAFDGPLRRRFLRAVH